MRSQWHEKKHDHLLLQQAQQGKGDTWSIPSALLDRELNFLLLCSHQRLRARPAFGFLLDLLSEFMISEVSETKQSTLAKGPPLLLLRIMYGLLGPRLLLTDSMSALSGQRHPRWHGRRSCLAIRTGVCIASAFDVM